MNWKPKKWIAALLGFFIPPLGMLYVLRVKWALIYFAANTLIAITEFTAKSSFKAPWLEYFSFNLILMLVCAVHAYRIAGEISSVELRPWYSRWYGLSSIPLVMMSCIFLFRSFFYEPFRMSASSMDPTFSTGTIILGKKSGYGNYGTYGISLMTSPATATISRGDVLVFQYPEKPSTNYVKRIIGLPGDSVEYRNKRLSINGTEIPTTRISIAGQSEVLEEKLGPIVYRIQNMLTAPATDFSFAIPQGHYFVMGDNRDRSNDSRYWGYVPARNLVAKVVHAF